MIGFHDHTTNRHSGRPEPSDSWQAERFITWTAWVMAATLVAGAAYYYAKWRELDGVMPMIGGAVLFSFIAYTRRKALERKQLEFRRAVAAYETSLARVGHDAH